MAGALWECRKHVRHLRRAQEAIGSMGPLDARRLEAFSDDEIRIVDQFIYRYTSLQDTLGQKAFKYLLDATQEPVPPTATFIDRLHVLERLGVLAVSEWENTRIIRNRLVHDYPDAEKRRQILQAALDTAPQMERILEHIRRLAHDKLGVHESGIDNRP
ncbi:MAG: hypothetical protein AB7O50_17325 [Pseudolabrys sp.]